MINLIDSAGKFNQKITEFPSANANVAIFGSQSSGKSTLLNKAFGTQFPTLNTRKTRQQCTKGVWYQHTNNMNIIDTEGFDSIQRVGQSRIYERQVALFSLAIADVILINVWMNQIGRYDGGQIGILKTILKAAGYLLKSQNKTIMFVIKDCTSDAETSILQQQLEYRVKTLIKESQANDKNTGIRFNLEYYFMSHYVYNFQAYEKQAKALPSKIRVRKSQLQQYQSKDRLIYMQHLWQTIISNDGEIDLRMQEQALRTFIVNRIRQEVKLQIDQQIKNTQRLGPQMTYQRYYEKYVKKSFELIKKKLPRFLDEKIIKTQFFILEEELEYTISTHFNDVILPNQEKYILTQSLDKQLRKSYKSIQLEKIIIKQRKVALQMYKSIVKGHKQAQILIKAFAQKITQSSIMYETQVSHLFNMFQNKLQLSINKQLDRQVSDLTFSGNKLSQKVKELCKKFDYNQWQLNLTEIWQKSIHRILTHKINERIDRASSRLYFTIWAGDKQAQIIAFHKRLQKQCQIFITNLLLYFDQDDIGTQYFEKAKQRIRSNLEKSLIKQKKRFRMTLLILGIFMIFFYTEFVMLLKMGKFKKRNRRYLANGYIFIIVVLIGVDLLKKRNRTQLSQ